MDWTLGLAIYGAAVGTASMFVAVAENRAAEPRVRVYANVNLHPSVWPQGKLRVTVVNAGRVDLTLDDVFFGGEWLNMKSSSDDLPYRLPGKSSVAMSFHLDLVDLIESVDIHRGRVEVIAAGKTYVGKIANLDGVLAELRLHPPPDHASDSGGLGEP